MNLEKRFIEISDFLKEHSLLINKEALDHYPNLPKQYKDWVCEISQIKTSERINLENNLEAHLIKDESYLHFLKKVRSLREIEKTSLPQQELDKRLKSKISLKKQHEIVAIADYLKDKVFRRIIDVGSGAAHLSSHLIAYNKILANCIDASNDYQKIGFKKLKKFAPEILDRLTFNTIEIHESSKIDIRDEDLLIGLHSCGDLSIHILKNFIMSQNGQVLNYGCCYHKLRNKNYNLSELAKQRGIKLNTFSLTLAAKGHKPQTLVELEKKIQVKSYRYGLHILNKDKLNKNFISVGNGLKSDYQMSFADYVNKFSPETLLHLSKTEIERFYVQDETQEKIKDLIHLGIIRSQLARLIECYIVLDRALWLKENGAKIDIKETFDNGLSPRNIALYGYYL